MLILKKVRLILLTISIAQINGSLVYADTKEECEKSNFTKCTFGLNWGSEITTKNASAVICPNVDKIEEMKNTISTPDWCDWAKRNKTCSTICGKNGQAYCYIGIRHSYEISAPDIRVLFHALGLFPLSKIAESVASFGPIMTPEEKQVATEDEFGINTYPVEYSKVDGVEQAKYLSTWNRQLISSITASIVPDGMDAKFFVIKAEQKYGKAEIKISSKQLIVNKYSDILIWRWTVKSNGPSHDDGPVHVMMVSPKDSQSKAIIYSGTFDIKTYVDISKKLNELNKNKKEGNLKEKEEQMNKGVKSVEY